MVPAIEGAFLPRRRAGRRRLPRRPGRMRRWRSRVAAPAVRVMGRVAARTLPRRTLLYPDALPVLSELRRRGFRLAAVTNGYLFYQMPILTHLRLADLLDDVVTPERVGVAKPDPRLWTEGLAGRQVAAHVGDRLSDDVMGARAAGLRTVWVNRSGRLPRRWPVRPDHTVDSLWGLLTLDLLGEAAAARRGPSA
jgi:FMN phosphatase YigB (HAD superfamily)